MLYTRRDALMQFLFGAGCVGLRALATGIPISILANPRQALAQAQATGAATAETARSQFVIMSASMYGDPLNANVPGTYLDPKVMHPQNPSMAATNLTIGATTYKAAAPWAKLPSSSLDRTCFFHQMTNTNVHPNQHVVMAMGGALRPNDMLPSFIAAQMAPVLGTAQTQPLCLGASAAGEALTFQGSPQPTLSPASLGATLGSPTGAISKLQSMRDAALNDLNAFFKSQGNSAQAGFIDQYVQSQQEVRNLSQSLIASLQALTDNSVSSQLKGAVILAQMKVAPVFTVHIPFGGDNHFDTGLDDETEQTVSGVASISQLMSLLQAAGLQDKVTFASLNVFGRTLSLAHEGYAGRDHNSDHHCGVMIGRNIVGGVVGAIAPKGNDYGCTAIASSSGLGDPSGDISQPDTMLAYGMTLAAAAGVNEDQINTVFKTSTAKIISSSLAG